MPEVLSEVSGLCNGGVTTFTSASSASVSVAVGGGRAVWMWVGVDREERDMKILKFPKHSAVSKTSVLPTTDQTN